MYYVTVPECEKHLREKIGADANIIIRSPYIPLITQLLQVPSGAEVMACPAAEWPKAEQDRFVFNVYETILNIEISRNTVDAYRAEWEENAFWNHEVCLTSPSVDKINKTGDYALVAGSGPSAKEFKRHGKPQIFAAWSSPVANDADFIGHCDHRAQGNPCEEPKQGIILTPCASKEFVKNFPNSVPYIYFDRGNRLNWRFAEKLGIPEHEPIVGHVVDLLTQCAIYAGHTKIRFIGVDLCCKTPEELKKYHPEAEPIARLNYRGEVVYTDEIFHLYQKGLEGLAARYPEIEFSVLSDQGIIMEGILYEPFETFEEAL